MGFPAEGSDSAIAALFRRQFEERQGGRRTQETDLLAALCLLSVTAGATQRRFWEAFRALAADFLEDHADSLNLGAGGAAALRRFLAETGYEEVAHFRRRDPHLWDVVFHAVRHDGRFLVCNGRYDGLVMATGEAGAERVEVAGRSKHPAAEEASLAVALKTIRGGFHASGGGREPVVKVIFNNGRPIDQSVAIARFDRIVADLAPAPRLQVLQNRGSAFFDPVIFPAIAALGKVEFYTPRTRDLRAEAEREGASLVEAFYLPDNGWAELSAMLLHLQASIPPPPHAAPREAEELRLFVSLEFEKRVWTEQAAALLALFAALRRPGRQLRVLVNGMTGVIFAPETAAMMGHYREVMAQEKGVIEGWQARMGEGFVVEHLAGADLVQKVHRIAGCHAFAAPGGTAALMGLLAGVPGVYYSHPELHRHFAGLLSRFPKGRPICAAASRADKAMRGVFNYGWAGVGGESYSIPAEDFVREALEALPFLA
ncbi:hypothetical protein JYK14_24930 [Siccirubricoccus sp. KC 17139]|uniref:Uncharacterized protein n=1 Tax=Siccirubricoccus soli TaxID=2899147 RepID=A0ABT1DBR2_9PROT|nr:hypothetical protein [Siccirubricoccus soli]MCO6419381.1 hypothetical protein [Siccirubricoccus soli]MCP2685516.1 hypothetical protein [Siccirubricoccus soli]